MTSHGYSEPPRSLQFKSSRKPAFSRAKWLNAVRADRTLSRSALHIAAALSDHFDKLGACFPSATRLAAIVGICERWARRLLHQLAKAGFISVEPNSGRVSTYRATFPTSHVEITAPAADSEPQAHKPAVSAQAPAAATPPELKPHLDIHAPEARVPVDVDTPAGRRIENQWRADTGRALPWRDKQGRVSFPAAWVASARLALGLA